MSARRIVSSRRLPGFCLAVALAGPLSAQSPDSTAAAAVRDYQTACAAEGGHHWGRSLCGPIILVDPRTRDAVASDSPPGGRFTRSGTLWQGQIPEGIPRANTGFDWAEQRWAMVLLPVPGDRYLRLQLLVHESFHRIQPALGLEGRDLLNPQLDERDGRYWLRLELNALAAALERSGKARDRAVRDAVLFRRYRDQLYPGADTLETALELQEGLAEYTGAVVALDALHLPPARAAQGLREFQTRPTYVRALGYGTGPGLGLLLDHYAPEWRARVRSDGVAAQLARAIRFRPPADLAAAARAAASRYQGDAVAKEEDARAAERARQLADYRARLVDGPVLRLRQDGLARAFNPNTLVAFGEEGTVYPTGAFSAAWGSLEVTAGGALVAPDYHLLRVPAPTDTTGGAIRGPGWSLKLAPGWSLAPGERAGDFAVVRR
jgi:hypothetical protein